MGRTVTTRGMKGTEPLRLPEEVELAELEAAGAVRALQVLIATIAETIARKEASRSPRRKEAAYRGRRLGREQAA
ncbi:MAG TPA: hypothetical protein VFW40_13285 [Capsulimonadaceae bacterium]|nr:hypothetical protein [Capsulimonadaceae bacterium]